MHYHFKRRLLFYIVLILALGVSSCTRFYHKYKLFQTDQSYVVDSINNQRGVSDRNYTLDVFDKFTFRVYTNNGELLIDPNQELSPVNRQTSTTVKDKQDIEYLITSDSLVHLPLIGKVNLVGYTVGQADSILSVKYEKFYTGAFVKVKFTSKRVIVFGSSGGKIIPLTNENINLIEVLALYGDVKVDANVTNIKVIRGELNNPDVQVINLNTIEGMKRAQLDVVPGDIIYIEPSRRIFRETIVDIMPLISATTSILTLVILFSSIQ
jgi:polysaccharide export outer membrane protein